MSPSILSGNNSVYCLSFYSVSLLLLTQNTEFLTLLVTECVAVFPHTKKFSATLISSGLDLLRLEAGFQFPAGD